MRHALSTCVCLLALIACAPSTDIQASEPADPAALSIDDVFGSANLAGATPRGLRFSPDGSDVEVEILPSGGWWLLSVRDHGPGLSESDLSNMFQRFYRGDPSRARSNRSGSGLGLSIVQQIAINHGGRVQARNQADGGTSIELLLPRDGQ